MGRDFEYQIPQSPAPVSQSAPADSRLRSRCLPTRQVHLRHADTMPRKALPDEYRNELAETVNWLHHRHIFKFGFDLNRVHDY